MTENNRKYSCKIVDTCHIRRLVSIGKPDKLFINHDGEKYFCDFVIRARKYDSRIGECGNIVELNRGKDPKKIKGIEVEL